MGWLEIVAPNLSGRARIGRAPSRLRPVAQNRCWQSGGDLEYWAKCEAGPLLDEQIPSVLRRWISSASGPMAAWGGTWLLAGGGCLSDGDRPAGHAIGRNPRATGRAARANP